MGSNRAGKPRHKSGKIKGNKTHPNTLENDDTHRQLLARTRYIITKKPNEWTINQKTRADLLFRIYTLLYQAYKHTLEFRKIYEQHLKKGQKNKYYTGLRKQKN